MNDSSDYFVLIKRRPGGGFSRVNALPCIFRGPCMDRQSAMQVRCEARKGDCLYVRFSAYPFKWPCAQHKAIHHKYAVQSSAVISTLPQSSPSSLHSFQKNPRLPYGVESKTMRPPLTVSISALSSAKSVELGIQIFLHRRWRRFYAVRHSEARASRPFCPCHARMTQAQGWSSLVAMKG
jgi:hypothetical protein